MFYVLGFVDFQPLHIRTNPPNRTSAVPVSPNSADNPDWLYLPVTCLFMAKGNWEIREGIFTNSYSFTKSNCFYIIGPKNLQRCSAQNWSDRLCFATSTSLVCTARWLRQTKLPGLPTPPPVWRTIRWNIINY